MRTRNLAAAIAFLPGALAFALREAEAGATPSARLVYSRARGASSCPDEADLRRGVASRIGYDPFFAWARTTIVARMAPGADGAGFVGTVNLIDEAGLEHGLREIRAEHDCAELLDPIALAIAIALDPQRLAGPAPPALSPPPPVRVTAPPRAATPATRTPAPPPQQETAPVPSPNFEWEASGGGVASIGVAPMPTAGLSLGIGAQRGAFSFDLEGRVDARTARPAPNDDRVSSALTVGTAAPCWVAPPVRLCALGQVGWMRTESDVTEQGELWIAAGGRVATWIALDERTAVAIQSDVLAHLRPPTLAFGPLDVWKAPVVVASFAVNVVVHFR